MCSIVRLRARLVVPVAAPAISGGALAIQDGWIAGIANGEQGIGTLDLGDVAILPGLVNAHTHLEFSDLDRPLGRPNQPLVDWIRDVIAHRSGRDADADTAIQAGLDECVRTGTTTVGEIATAGWQPDSRLGTPVRMTVFRELRGMSAARVTAAVDDAREHLSTAGRASWRAGLSPHAPYSVADVLFDEAVAMSVETDAPLALHLGESPEEIEFMQTRGGAFRELLDDLGAWDDAALAAACAPIDYLRKLAGASRGLVIHGNYLDSESLDFLASRADRLALVYCPRTHHYFGHPRHPAAGLLRRGGVVALGTDSRASTPDLNLWAEMRFAARHDPGLRPGDVLRMGTLAGAQALGLANTMGSLEVGKKADLTIVAGATKDDGDASRLLVSDDSRVVATVIDGLPRYANRDWLQTLDETARHWFEASM